MIGILQSLPKTIHLSIAISVLLLLGLFFGGDLSFDRLFWSWLFRYFHVISGVMWIGLLWYLNFVQIPSMPKFTDEQKPAITKVIAPAVLFWFRWAALATIVTGLIVAYLNGYVHQALALGIGSGGGKNTAIGIGMWLGLIMAFNVWFIIWPNQKKVLGIVEATPEEKPISLKKAVLASRVNTLLSLPMLLSMVAAQNLY
ncbi:MAG: urate hydroxylase PuuD [Pelagibacteraceae bacterium]|nr:urate hydroxylase PuuD [Pelagibacteraceae bacterium]MBO6493353.1 urate hydroxylase PuuD [Pelagibacteraceae bacterium]